ncbi:carboxymuconolactone decarboxylase family protein [Aureimonas sp. Leaf324]|uniref:carboxymuconolactone decarboxylase family protein n=1 Tax=Aureimonas sp. Leaf324 TaxID=1736336 RepID=UPI0006FA46EF|nr:carboxymuconolactone decarboxylase family protein [Aureimonas sp. Leaf324]KQQ85662.1 4-carboxymuconolactone decarboxylase [Aureimonas sp. Leaf324]
MKLLSTSLLTVSLGTTALAQESTQNLGASTSPSVLSRSDIVAVSPALARYGQDAVVGGLWERPQLSRRDRSLVTAAILIARGQTIDLGHYMTVALDNGVTPAELSETITHLAFYAGWSNAMSAVAIAKTVFADRGIEVGELPAASPTLRPIDERAEATRQDSVERLLGTSSPGLAEFTTDPLFVDVWLRPDLGLRDRSLVTITSLMANGQVAQLPGHLNRAMDNGLTKEEAGEVVTQIAFYAGWPNAFSAGPVVRDVVESRSN